MFCQLFPQRILDPGWLYVLRSIRESDKNSPIFTLRLKLNGVKVVDGRQMIKARMESDEEIFLTKNTNIMSQAYWMDQNRANK